MEKVDYDGRLHAVYAAGRQMSPAALRIWMDAFARHLPETRPLVWLDLGSGTGRMTPTLASTFGAAHGVEPSDKMRAQAIDQATRDQATRDQAGRDQAAVGQIGHPTVMYAAGSAEQIPLPDASCDAALLFFVWHHVVDRESAVRELRRVVKPGGKLFVQVNFSDRMPDVWWFRVMPEIKKADTAQFRPEQDVIADFADAGWTLVSRDEVRWPRSASLAEDIGKLKLRSVSAFEHMTEEAIEASFAQLEAALPSLEDGLQYETNRLLVFQR